MSEKEVLKPRVLVLQKEDIEEYIPTVRQADLTTTSLVKSSRLIMAGASGDELGLFNASGTENVELFLAMNDLLTQRPELAIDYFTPALDLTGMGITRMFANSRFPVGKSFRADPDHGNSTTHYYTSQLNLRRSIFPRDMVQFASRDGKQTVVVSTQASDRNMTQYSFALALGKDFGFEVVRMPVDFQGGNLIVTDDFIMTLHNFARMNNFDDMSPSGILDTHDTNWIDFGKPIAVLDHLLRQEERQRVFHLDLILNCVKGSDGNEYFLLASLNKAKEVLNDSGLLESGNVNVGMWLNVGGYPQFTHKMADKFTRDLAVDFFKAAGKKATPREIDAYVANFGLLTHFPYAAHRCLGINKRQFFDPKNLEPVTEYTEVVRQSLLNLGIPPDRILDIPALIFSTGFQDYDDSRSDITAKLMSERRIPIYTPVNGVQLSTKRDENIYVSGGGVRPLDEYTTNVLANLGIRNVPVPSVLGLGFGEAGFRCVAVPKPDGVGVSN